ncbi:RlpA-like double-psi beta-barrel domain [Phaffia rhodozyma]|uniref:RlpA-like double-psi beta-barrel domain n=1 Tax=Phaffia rhodozyma TaxID=264483 RepID=A0A0F7SM92_PHARH|nr:RlpA-like double-psi beta-barrel domain [Phaffia rhodozyma]
MAVTFASAFSLHPRTGRPHQGANIRELTSNIRARDAHVVPDRDSFNTAGPVRRVRKRAICNTSSSSSSSVSRSTSTLSSSSSSSSSPASTSIKPSSSSSSTSSSSSFTSTVKSSSAAATTTSTSTPSSSSSSSPTPVSTSTSKSSSSSATATPTSTSSFITSSSSSTSRTTSTSTSVSSATKTTTSTSSVYIATDVASVIAVWPTVTQSGSSPSATVTSKADPYAQSLSYALNNSGNTLFTNKRTAGDLTYYEQGQTSCGSVYDDTTFTAAVSSLLYDAWPGASSNTNRNPICGPFSPGRLDLSSNVKVASAYGSVMIGGDGLLNCVSSSMCHIPLTATLTYSGKSAKVLIVDRCEGCAVDDIDVTPAVFKYLTGSLDIGRVYGTSGTFSWSFDTAE